MPTDLLKSEQVVVLIGLGGVGKTQLARAWLDDHRRDFKVVWGLRAVQEATLIDDLAALADDRQLCERTAALPDKLAAARRWFKDNERWLLVFDNATDPSTVAFHLPTGGDGKVLIISQGGQWPYASLPVLPWSRSDAVEFLANHSPADYDVAAALAMLLGGLPLALEQARAYLAATGRPAATYLAALHEQLTSRTGGLLAAETPSHQETVATIWALALREIRRIPGSFAPADTVVLSWLPMPLLVACSATTLAYYR